MSRSSGKTQTLEVRNAEQTPLEIMVEMDPDRYILKPGSTMEIEADLLGAPFHIVPFSGGLQIHAGNADDKIVRIDGAVAESWIDP